jgi:hypothetical protein
MLPHKPEDWPPLFVQHLNLLANPRSAINSNDTNFVFDTNVNFDLGNPDRLSTPKKP